jgi:hypothetical protein
MEAYASRFQTMWYLCGPGAWPFLFATPADVAAARAAAGGADPRPARLLAATLHPDTGAPIPLPFRMAAHVPVNAVLLLGMLTSTSPLATGAWQAANQLFNAAQFYANRNATNDVPDAQLALSLAGSLASSVAVASGLRVLCLRAGGGGGGGGAAPAAAGALGLAIPFLGAAAGKPLQIGCMRADELTQGVEVHDALGAPCGRSPAAGRLGVGLTIATRTLYLAPMLWMPYAQRWLERSVPLLARSRPAATASYLLHAAFNSAVVTPACIALFEQRSSVAAEALEPQFQGRVDAQGRAVTRFFFNKGL